MPFRNSILAGTTLVREAIQSQNYEGGVSGWIIRSDGTAEFADLTIRSSDGSGASVEIENGKAVFTAANGWQIIIDPTNVLPIIYFLDASGDEMASINASGVEDQAALVLASGPFSDGVVTDWRWAQIMGDQTAGDRATIRRLRDEDESVFKGGYLQMSPTIAQYGVVDSQDSTVNNFVHFEDHFVAFDGGRLIIGAPASVNPSIWLQADEGQTGPLLELDEGGVTKCRVTEAGDVQAAGSLSAANLRSGTANTPAPGAGGGVSTVAVVFDVPMNGTPAVTITPASAADPQGTVVRGYVDDRSATGFTIRGYRSTNSLTVWSYVAVAP